MENTAAVMALQQVLLFTDGHWMRKNVVAGNIIDKRPDVTFHNSMPLQLKGRKVFCYVSAKRRSTTNQAFARLSADGGTSWYRK